MDIIRQIRAFFTQVGHGVRSAKVGVQMKTVMVQNDKERNAESLVLASGMLL